MYVPVKFTISLVIVADDDSEVDHPGCAMLSTLLRVSGPSRLTADWVSLFNIDESL